MQTQQVEQRIAACALITNDEGKILLFPSQDKILGEPGKWELPYDEVQSNEKIVGAIIRQLKSKQIDVVIGRWLGYYEQIILHVGQPQYWLIQTHLCKFVNANSMSENLHATWFSFSEISNMRELQLLTIVTQDTIEALKIVEAEGWFRQRGFLRSL